MRTGLEHRPSPRVWAPSRIGLSDMEKLVSIFLPAYNAAEFVADPIESVLAQMWPRKEIIVVNDGLPGRHVGNRPSVRVETSSRCDERQRRRGRAQSGATSCWRSRGIRAGDPQSPDQRSSSPGRRGDRSGDGQARKPPCRPDCFRYWAAGMSEEFVRESLFVPFRTTKRGGWGLGFY
jgi:cellulose synthase/poly-beta-1,6-N-acetylglucosamine synthase-like glycosyltransferase